jgi:hypothetical protein
MVEMIIGSGPGKYCRSRPYHRLDSTDSRPVEKGIGNSFIMFLKRGRKEIAVGAGTSREDSRTPQETISKGQSA